MQNQWSFRTKSRLKAIDTTVKVSQVIGKKNSSWNPFYPSFTDETVVLVTEDKRTYETTKASADGNWNLTFSLRWLADDGSTTEVAKFKRAWMPWTLMFVTLWSDTLEWKQDNLIAWANIQIAADWKTISATDTIPNNATITIQKNWTDIESFTADESTNKTINITVPVTAADVSALPDSTKYWATIDMSINSSTYVVTLTLKDQDWNTLWSAQTIDLPIESVVVSGSYDSVNKKIVLTLQSWSTIEFSVADLVSGLQTEITSSNKLSADLVDDSSTTNKFVTAADLTKLSNTSWTNTWDQTASDFDIKDLADTTSLRTTWSGKQDALISWTNIKTINNQDLLWSGNITISWWSSMTEVTVSTAYWTAAKVGTTTAGNYTPSVWDLLLVNFVYWNTANSVTLNIDNSWAKNIEIWWANANRNTLNLVSSNTATNSYVLMTYDGTNYVTHSTANTSYTAGTWISISWTGVISSTSNIKVFYLASGSDLTTAQEAYDWQIWWKTAIVIYSDKPYIFTRENTVSMTFACFLYEELQEAGNSKTSLIRKVITLSVSSGTVTSISVNAWNNVMASVLKTDTDYVNPYTPQYNWSPTTKKYVDDNDTYIWSSAPSNPAQWKLWYDTVNDVLKTYDGTNWNSTGWGWSWDVSYSDFAWQTKSWATIELALNTYIDTPTADFTINAPSTIKDGMVYILRIDNWATAYTMTLWTNIDNSLNVSTALSANGTDQFVFLAFNWQLELQPEVSL